MSSPRPRRFGLPETVRMRHDPHFVDQLGRPSGLPVGQLVPIEDITPNPQQSWALYVSALGLPLRAAEGDD